MINVFQPSLGEEELKAISEVFESNWLGKGKRVNQFEVMFSEYLGVDKKLINSINCCTEGLFSSMEILGIGKDDEVILPTISFVGAANAVCHNGSKMVLCDVDSKTLNATATEIEKKITKKTKAILLLHYGGVPCEMDSILDLARSYNLKVIEDSACSVASRYKGKACGTLGDVGIWSFDAMKILVCGDGGAIFVKDEELSDYVNKLLYFGLESTSGFSNTVDCKWWEYEISQFGHRSIMNDVTASMALVQLEKLPRFIDSRKRIHRMYNEYLKDVSWIDLPPKIPEFNESSFYFYHIQVKGNERDELASFLRENGIYTTFRYYPIHKVKKYGMTSEKFINAEYAANHTLCLPIHQAIKDDEVLFISKKIIEFGAKKNL